MGQIRANTILTSGGCSPFDRYRFTNPEMIRRGRKTAGPPLTELPPDMVDSEGVNATII